MAVIHARTDDWRPANPRISVGGWIGAFVIVGALYIAAAALLGHLIVGDGSPYLNSSAATESQAPHPS
jgi:hypothetical protein